MNKEQSIYYKGLALADLPIDFYGSNIYQPKIKEVLQMGDNRFFNLFKPFLFSDKLIPNVEALPFKISILDYSIFIKGESNATLLEDILCSIKYFFKLEDNDIKLNIIDEDRVEGVSEELGLKRVSIILRDITVINSDNYDELRKIILLICGDRQEINPDDLKKEKEIKCAKDEDNDRLAKLFKGRQRQKDKKKKIDDIKSTTTNIYNTVVHMDGVVDYDKVLNWNFYRLVNTYLTLQKKEYYQFDKNIKSSGMVSLEGVDIPDLTNLIIISENEV